MGESASETAPIDSAKAARGWIWGCKKQRLLAWMGLNEVQMLSLNVDHYSEASHGLSECKIQ